jgi:hypothetical protein
MAEQTTCCRCHKPFTRQLQNPVPVSQICPNTGTEVGVGASSPEMNAFRCSNCWLLCGECWGTLQEQVC